MLHKLLGSRAFMSIAGTVAVVAVAVVGYLVAFQPLKATTAYCAIMPDSVGLYPGNQVTMRGITVGNVVDQTFSNIPIRLFLPVPCSVITWSQSSIATTLGIGASGIGKKSI